MRGGAKMITFFALVLVAIAVVIIALFAVGAGGFALFIVFGDVLVAGAIIYLIIRAILKK